MNTGTDCSGGGPLLPDVAPVVSSPVLVPEPPVDPPGSTVPLLLVASAPLLPPGSPVVGEDALDVEAAPDPLVSPANFVSSLAVLHAAASNAPNPIRPIALTRAP